MPFPIIEMPRLTPENIIFATWAEERRPGFDLHRDELAGRIAFLVDDLSLGVDAEIALQLSAE